MSAFQPQNSNQIVSPRRVSFGGVSFNDDPSAGAEVDAEADAAAQPSRPRRTSQLPLSNRPHQPPGKRGGGGGYISHVVFDHGL